MRIKKDDNVIILAGKDKGKKGKVLQASHRDGKVIVEGVRIVKKHLPARSGRAGERIEMEFPMTVSNVQLLCPKCNAKTRVGYTVLEDGKKQRVCKKCSAEI